MSNYEIMFIARPNLEEESLKEAREKVQAVITERGGQVAEVEDMGKRRFAYTINYNHENYRDGFYTVYKFATDNAEVITELDRVINIDDRILRHLTINLDEK